MSLEFENEQFQPRSAPKATENKGITGWFIKIGIVKNKKQANYIQAGLIAILLVVMFVAIRSM